MDDLISRQAAIDLVRDVCDAILSGCGCHYDSEVEDEVYDDLLEVDAILKCNKAIRKSLKDLPSAQPERQKGKWEITEFYPHNVYCSECHHKFAQTHWAVWEDGTLPRNYCPNCGSYNGGRDDEAD